MGHVLVNKARPDDFSLNVTCKRCESEVVATPDMLLFARWKVGGYWFAGTEVIEDRFSFICPACEHEATPIDQNLIPVGIRDDLIEDYKALKASGAQVI